MKVEKIDLFTTRQRLQYRFLRRFLSDRQYSLMSLRRWDSQSPSLITPKSFNEKLRYLGLHERSSLHTLLADKLAAKDYVKRIGGSSYLIETIKIWDRASDISLEEISRPCVIKANHTSGTTLFYDPLKCSDKKKLIQSLHMMFKKDQYRQGREWPYKNIIRKIFAEELVVGTHSQLRSSLDDYKVYCFNGIAHFIHVDTNRFEDHRRVFYDREWNKLDIIAGYEMATDVDKPDRLSEMIELAEELSKPFCFVRCDFYATPQIKFGEMTFYPDSAETRLSPDYYNRLFGDLICLDSIRPSVRKVSWRR